MVPALTLTLIVWRLYFALGIREFASTLVLDHFGLWSLRSFLKASTPCHPTPASGSCPINRGVQIVKVDPRHTTEFDQGSTSSDNSHMQSWVCSEATSECYPLAIVQTGLCDKMLTNCNIAASNDSVISCDNIQFNYSFLCLLAVTKKFWIRNWRNIIHVSLRILKILRICICKWTHPQTALQYILVCPASCPRCFTSRRLLASKYRTKSRYRNMKCHDISISLLGYDMNPSCITDTVDSMTSNRLKLNAD